MAEGVIGVSIIPDANSANAIRKTIESATKGLGASLSNASISKISTDIKSKVVPSINVSVNKASLASMTNVIRNNIGKITPKILPDTAGIANLKRQVREAVSPGKVDDPNIRSLRSSIAATVKRFDQLSAAKDRFAANVAQKFPMIIGSVRSLNTELATSVSLMNKIRPLATGPTGRGTAAVPPPIGQPISGLANQQEKVARATNIATGAISKHTKGVREASAATVSFAERIGFTTSRLAAYLIPAAGIFQLFSAFRYGITAIREIDAEVNKLTQILDGQKESASRLTDQILNLSVAYGQSGREILKVANVLAQAGIGADLPINIPVDLRTEERLRQITLLTDALAKTKLAATFGDIDETTQGLIAIFGQFNLQVEDTNRILDVTNQLSKDFAVEASDIFEAVRRGGATFALAGGQFEEFAAIVTALRQLTRLPGTTIGTGIQTIALRSARREVIQQQEAITAGIGGIRDQEGALLPLVDRWRQVAKATRNYNIEELSPIVEKMAGIREAKFFVPLLRDLQRGGAESVVAKALDEVDRSAGSLNRDAAIGLQRIDVQLQSIGARFEKTFKTLSENEGIRQLVRAFATLAKTLASVLEAAAPLLPVLIAFGSIKLAGSILTGLPSLFKGLTIHGGLTRTGIAPGTLFDITTRPRGIQGREGKGGIFAPRLPTSPKGPRGSVGTIFVPNPRQAPNPAVIANTTGITKNTGAAQALTQAVNKNTVAQNKSAITQNKYLNKVGGIIPIGAQQKLTTAQVVSKLSGIYPQSTINKMTGKQLKDALKAVGSQPIIQKVGPVDVPFAYEQEKVTRLMGKTHQSLNKAAQSLKQNTTHRIMFPVLPPLPIIQSALRNIPLRSTEIIREPLVRSGVSTAEIVKLMNPAISEQQRVMADTRKFINVSKLSILNLSKAQVSIPQVGRQLSIFPTKLEPVKQAFRTALSPFLSSPLEVNPIGVSKIVGPFFAKQERITQQQIPKIRKEIEPILGGFRTAAQSIPNIIQRETGSLGQFRDLGKTIQIPQNFKNTVDTLNKDLRGFSSQVQQSKNDIKAAPIGNEIRSATRKIAIPLSNLNVALVNSGSALIKNVNKLSSIFVPKIRLERAPNLGGFARVGEELRKIRVGISQPPSKSIIQPRPRILLREASLRSQQRFIKSAEENRIRREGQRTNKFIQSQSVRPVSVGPLTLQQEKQFRVSQAKVKAAAYKNLQLDQTTIEGIEKRALDVQGQKLDLSNQIKNLRMSVNRTVNQMKGMTAVPLVVGDSLKAQRVQLNSLLAAHRQLTIEEIALANAYRSQRMAAVTTRRAAQPGAVFQGATVSGFGNKIIPPIAPRTGLEFPKTGVLGQLPSGMRRNAIRLGRFGKGIAKKVGPGAIGLISAVGAIQLLGNLQAEETLSLINQEGEIRKAEIQELIKKNEERRRSQKKVSGAQTGGLFGSFLAPGAAMAGLKGGAAVGTAFGGPAGMIIGGGLGAILGGLAPVALGAGIGAGIGSLQDPVKETVDELFNLAAAAKNLREAAFPLLLAMDKLSKQADLGGSDISRAFKEPISVGLGKFDINAIRTPKFVFPQIKAFDPGSKLARAIGFEEAGVPFLRDIKNLVINPFNTASSDFVTELRKNLTGTEAGQAFLDRVRTASLEAVPKLGKLEPGQDVAGAIRTILTPEFAKGFKESSILKGKEITQDEALVTARLHLSESMKILEGSTYNLSRPLIGAKDNFDLVNKSLLGFGKSIDEFTATFVDRTEDINRQTANIETTTKFNQQILQGIISGQPEPFQFPENFGTVLAQNMKEELQNVGFGDLPSSFFGQLQRTGGLTQRQQIQSIVDRFGKGFLDKNERNVLGDVAQLQNFLRGIGTTTVRAFAKTALTKEQLESGKFGDQLAGLVENIVKSSGVELETEEGRNLLNKLVVSTVQASKAAPERFTEDPGAFITEVFKSFADGKEVMDRNNAVLNNVNAKLIKQAQVIDYATSVQEKLIDVQQKTIGLQISRAQRGFELGATPLQIIKDLDSVIAALVPNTQTLIGDQSKLTRASRELYNAQLEYSTFLDKTGQVRGDVNVEAVVKSQRRLTEATDSYTHTVQELENVTNVVRSRFEKVTQEINNLVAAQQQLGKQPISNTLDQSIALNQFNSITGTIAKELENLGVTSFAQVNKLSAETQRGFATRISPVIGTDFFSEILGKIESLGPFKFSGTDQTVKERAELFTGLGSIETMSRFFSSLDPNILPDLMKQQQSDFDLLNKLEDQQLSTLNTINQSVLIIAQRVIESSDLSRQEKERQNEILNQLSQRGQIPVEIKQITNGLQPVPPIINNVVGDSRVTGGRQDRLMIEKSIKGLQKVEPKKDKNIISVELPKSVLLTPGTDKAIISVQKYLENLKTEIGNSIEIGEAFALVLRQNKKDEKIRLSLEKNNELLKLQTSDFIELTKVLEDLKSSSKLVIEQQNVNQVGLDKIPPVRSPLDSKRQKNVDGINQEIISAIDDQLYETSNALSNLSNLNKTKPVVILKEPPTIPKNGISNAVEEMKITDQTIGNVNDLVNSFKPLYQIEDKQLGILGTMNEYVRIISNKGTKEKILKESVIKETEKIEKPIGNKILGDPRNSGNINKNNEIISSLVLANTNNERYIEAFNQMFTGDFTTIAKELIKRKEEVNKEKGRDQFGKEELSLDFTLKEVKQKFLTDKGQIDKNYINQTIEATEKLIEENTNKIKDLQENAVDHIRKAMAIPADLKKIPNNRINQDNAHVLKQINEFKKASLNVFESLGGFEIPIITSKKEIVEPQQTTNILQPVMPKFNPKIMDGRQDGRMLEQNVRGLQKIPNDKMSQTFSETENRDQIESLQKFIKTKIYHRDQLREFAQSGDLQPMAKELLRYRQQMHKENTAKGKEVQYSTEELNIDHVLSRFKHKLKTSQRKVNTQELQGIFDQINKDIDESRLKIQKLLNIQIINRKEVMVPKSEVVRRNVLTEEKKHETFNQIKPKDLQVTIEQISDNRERDKILGEMLGGNFTALVKEIISKRTDLNEQNVQSRVPTVFSDQQLDPSYVLKEVQSKLINNQGKIDETLIRQIMSYNDNMIKSDVDKTNNLQKNILPNIEKRPTDLVFRGEEKYQPLSFQKPIEEVRLPFREEKKFTPSVLPETIVPRPEFKSPIEKITPTKTSVTQENIEVFRQILEQLRDTRILLSDLKNSDSINRNNEAVLSLEKSMEAFRDALVKSGGIKTELTVDGDINIRGIETIGRDVAVAYAISNIMENFAKLMDRSDPNQAQMADKLQILIKQLRSQNK